MTYPINNTLSLLKEKALKELNQYNEGITTKAQKRIEKAKLKLNFVIDKIAALQELNNTIENDIKTNSITSEKDKLYQNLSSQVILEAKEAYTDFNAQIQKIEKMKQKHCTNPGCNKNGLETTFTKCDQCFKARYCSITCKIADLKRHKSECQPFHI